MHEVKEPIIRVAVIWDTDTMYVISDSALLVSNSLQVTKLIRPNTYLLVTVKSDSVILLSLTKKPLLTDKNEILLESQGNIKIGTHLKKLTGYHSKIQVKKNVKHRFYTSSSLTAINILPVEKYLYGVVSCELGLAKEAEFEALKALAVCARSYVYTMLGRRDDFDIYGSYMYDQEYRGVEREYRLAKLAVDATRGEVLKYDNNIAFAQYHACCGGKTANGRYPYLKSIVDAPRHSKHQIPFCSDSPYYRWKVKLSYQAFLDTILYLAGVGYKFYFIPEAIFDKTSERLNYLKFTADKEYKISGDAVRKALNLRSTFFTIKKIGDSLEIDGKGWGHGIGLCQYGALAMARRGYSYRQILGHYYYRTKITKLY
ncbi:MAG: SpoIID/LytB domain-containing protein [candidate division WOR-3 bacterium]